MNDYGFEEVIQDENGVAVEVAVNTGIVARTVVRQDIEGFGHAFIAGNLPMKGFMMPGMLTRYDIKYFSGTTMLGNFCGRDERSLLSEPKHSRNDSYVPGGKPVIIGSPEMISAVLRDHNRNGTTTRGAMPYPMGTREFQFRNRHNIPIVDKVIDLQPASIQHSRDRASIWGRGILYPCDYALNSNPSYALSRAFALHNVSRAIGDTRKSLYMDDANRYYLAASPLEMRAIIVSEDVIEHLSNNLDSESSQMFLHDVLFQHDVFDMASKRAYSSYCESAEMIMKINHAYENSLAAKPVRGRVEVAHPANGEATPVYLLGSPNRYEYVPEISSGALTRGSEIARRICMESNMFWRADTIDYCVRSSNNKLNIETNFLESLKENTNTFLHCNPNDGSWGNHAFSVLQDMARNGKRMAIEGEERSVHPDTKALFDRAFDLIDISKDIMKAPLVKMRSAATIRELLTEAMDFDPEYNKSNLDFGKLLV